MKGQPNNLNDRRSAGKDSESPQAPQPTVRRVEVTIEREVISIRHRAGTRIEKGVEICNCCGKAISPNESPPTQSLLAFSTDCSPESAQSDLPHPPERDEL